MIATAVISPFILLKEMNIIYKFMFMVLFGVFSKGTLEMCYYIGMGMTDYWDLVLLSASGVILLLYNRQFKILKINKLFVGLCLLQIIVLVAMWQTGFFEALKNFLFLGIGPDPHNWLWAISKTNGMLMWLSLIDVKDKKEVR